MHDARNTARTNFSRPVVAQPLNERAADCANGVAEHLAEFGAPKSKCGARLNVVTNRPSVSRTGRATAIQNLAPEEWRPQYPCSMTLDKALREMEMPSHLAGASWTVP